MRSAVSRFCRIRSTPRRMYGSVISAAWRSSAILTRIGNDSFSTRLGREPSAFSYYPSCLWFCLRKATEFGEIYRSNARWTIFLKVFFGQKCWNEFLFPFFTLSLRVIQFEFREKQCNNGSKGSIQVIICVNMIVLGMFSAFCLLVVVAMWVFAWHVIALHCFIVILK